MSVDRPARSASSGYASIPLALLVFTIWLAFAPALDAGFVNYDDTELLVNNARFRGFGAAELSWMFTTTHLGPYQPLSWLSYAADHAVGGMDPAVFHRTNLLLHAAGAIALYFLARRVIVDLAGTARAELGAFAAALLFAVHPLRVESVAWCTERRDVLAAPFFFLALLCWWRYARGAGRRDYALALVFLVLSLLAKASAIVVPALLVLLDLGPLREAARARGMRRLVLEKLPVLAIVIPFAWIAAAGQASDASMASFAEHGPLTRGIQAGYGALFYVARTLWPVDLFPLHRIPPIEQFSAAWMLVPAAVTLAATVLALVRWKRAAAIAWAWIAFLVILSPVSGLVQAGAQLVADRYSYLACVPLALLVGAGLLRVARQRSAIAWGLLALLACVFAWRTNAQTRVWHDSWSLWAHTLAIDPDNDTALANLAVLELETAQSLPDPKRARDMLLSANAHAARSAELKPEPRRVVNLAATYVKLADFEPERGPEHFRRAVESMERARALSTNLGVRFEPSWGLVEALANYRAERWPEALRAGEATLGMRDDPRPLTLAEELDLRRLTADVLGRLDRARDAVLLMEQTTRLAPDDPLVWLELSRAHQRAGDATRAREAAREGRARADRRYGTNAQREPWYVDLVQRGR